VSRRRPLHDHHLRDARPGPLDPEVHVHGVTRRVYMSGHWICCDVFAIVTPLENLPSTVAGVGEPITEPVC
jgi:hypothetical protein